jgi:putative oxidoreductase
MNLVECQAWALLIVRLVVGSTFIMHGSQKVFGSGSLKGFVDYVQGMGSPAWLGYIAAFFEFLGGISVFFGIAPEVGALMVMQVMLGAIVLVHWSKGYFVQFGGYEYALNLILLCVAIIIGGPGKFFLWDPFIMWRM